MATSNSNPSQNQLSEEFMTEFNRRREKIASQINLLTSESEPNEKLTAITADIQKLSKDLHDAVLFLPSYSIKIRQNEIRDLEKMLKEKEDILVPKKRFGFKSKLSQQPQPINKSAEPSVVNPSANENANKHLTSVDNFFTIENVKNQTVSYLEKELNGNDVLVKDSSDSVILLAGSPSTLRLMNLKNCKLLCGPVHTSVFVDNLNDSVLFLCCKQLRTHSSENVDIYLKVVSRAIIEDCKNIRFGPYLWEDEKSKELHSKTNISYDLQRYDAVDDFNWLSSEPSPNWSLIPSSEYVKFMKQEPK